MKIEIYCEEHEALSAMLFADTLINQRLENVYGNNTKFQIELDWIEQVSEHLAIWVKHAKEVIND